MEEYEANKKKYDLYFSTIIEKFTPDFTPGCQIFRRYYFRNETLNDKQSKEEHYQQAKEVAKHVEDFISLAENVIEDLSNDKWGKELYQEAETRAEAFTDYSFLAESIIRNTNDEDWGKRLYKKAEDLARSFSSYIFLAESLLRDLNDKEWSKKICAKAEKCEGPQDFIYLAELIILNLDDKEWAVNIYRKLIESGFCDSCWALFFLGESIKKNIKDKKNLQTLVDDITKRDGDFSTLISLAECVIKLNDKERGKLFYKKSENLAKTCVQHCSLASSILDSLADQDWGINLYKKAEGLAKSSSDFLYLSASILGNLDNKHWAKELSEKGLKLQFKWGDS